MLSFLTFIVFETQWMRSSTFSYRPWGSRAAFFSSQRSPRLVGPPLRRSAFLFVPGVDPEDLAGDLKALGVRPGSRHAPGVLRFWWVPQGKIVLVRAVRTSPGSFLAPVFFP